MDLSFYGRQILPDVEAGKAVAAFPAQHPDCDEPHLALVAFGLEHGSSAFVNAHAVDPKIRGFQAIALQVAGRAAARERGWAPVS